MLGEEVATEEILSENKRVIGGIRLALKREYYHCLKEGEKIVFPRVNDTLKNSLDKIDKISAVSMGITSIPLVINGSVLLISFSVAMVAGLIVLNNVGIETKESIGLLNGIEAVMNNLEGITVKFSNGFFKHLPAFLIPLGISFANNKVSDLLEDRNDKKIRKNEEYQEMLTDEMIYIDDIVQMIKDVKSDRADISLNFIQEFLSNVDLRGNSRNFNMQVLSYLAEYRVAKLKEENNEVKKDEADEKFIDFIDFLKNSKVRDGASESFIDNVYVRGLVKTYSDETQIKKGLNGLEKIK